MQYVKTLRMNAGTDSALDVNFMVYDLGSDFGKATNVGVTLSLASGNLTQFPQFLLE